MPLIITSIIYRDFELGTKYMNTTHLLNSVDLAKALIIATDDVKKYFNQNRTQPLRKSLHCVASILLAKC